MFRWLALLMALLLTGCVGGTYKIPQEEYRQRVRTLGVLPIMVDEDSAFNHPQRSRVIDLLHRHNDQKQEPLVELLRGTRGYFDVRSISADPRRLFSEVVTGSQVAGEEASLVRRYRFSTAGVSRIAEANVVDALLVVVLNGVERREKRRDRTLISYLDADYNAVLATAAVISAAGEVLWEYTGDQAGVFLHLQYPDFDEAYYNKAEAVRIKDVSVNGLDRSLGETGRGVFARSSLGRPYRELFDALVAALKPGVLTPLQSRLPGGGKSPSAGQ